jgi:hypothetical protein
MQFTTALLALAATFSLAAAQTLKCDAQQYFLSLPPSYLKILTLQSSIVDACVSGYKSRIDSCTTANVQDFICLCDVYTDVLVCYNNCPQSNDRFPVKGTMDSYCGAALPLRAAASASVASVASVAATQSHAPSATASSASAAKSAGGNAASVTPTAPSFQSTGGAVAVGVPAGAAMVAFLGAVGWF